MKRNWDMIRAVLIRIEGQPTPTFELYARDFDPMDEASVSYHLRLMRSAGLIEGIPREPHGISPTVIATGLTWSGHELLEAMRSAPVWNRVREIARQKSITLSFEAINLLVKAAIEVGADGCPPLPMDGCSPLPMDGCPPLPMDGCPPLHLMDQESGRFNEWKAEKCWKNSMNFGPNLQKTPKRASRATRRRSGGAAWHPPR